MTEHAYAYPAAAQRRRRGPRDITGPGAALALAGACLLALALTWLIAEHVPAVRVRDAALLRDFTRLDHPGVERFGHFLLHLLDPSLFILWGVALVCFAVGRGRSRVGVAVFAVLALAPFTAETLKPLLAHPHVRIEGVGVGAASWPSGHATAAVALVLCAVLVAPARLRPLVAALGGLFVLAVCCALLILAWHMPSDVLGGVLVASFWAALAVSLLRAAELRWPTDGPGPSEEHRTRR